KVAEYREECRGMGITIEPPDVNASDFEFIVQRPGTSGTKGTDGADGRVDQKLCSKEDPSESARELPEKSVIRFGLGAIKGVGGKAVAAIVDERDHKGPYENLFDFCERVDLAAVNRATIEALICAGAFDRTGAMRKALIDALDRAITGGQTAQQDRRSGQLGLFAADDGSSVTDQPEPVIGTEEWSESDMLAREKAVLGFYITRHPLASCERLLNACATATTIDLGRRRDGDEVVVGGMVSSMRIVTAKTGRNKGRRLGIVTLEDLKGRVEAIVFPDDLIQYQAVLAPDAIAFLEGSVDRKREEPSLRVSRVVRAADAVGAFARALVLDLSQGIPMDGLLGLLRAHPGDCPVYLNVETGSDFVAQIECHASLRVVCEMSLLFNLVACLGPEAVCVIGHGQRAIPFAVEGVGLPSTTHANPVVV
ncbi:MAG: hypothetical protein JSU63_03680, partial [Phycisphaerales bacterium]